ncbi:adenine nucleotide alpha hydrolase [Empedobacter brevis]|uniref:Adenine nucleotide alpha hydrolase n=1 Tax=Empedobacter brevis TaxID=247 RepID=A0AAJ1QDP0_9FLAO|nr:ATP-binding protein [Empedobacter brevis]MDM1072163.1 adenine nucleotide alpha hydrolase [Empedobacter brevis]QHC83881.1 ATP-binding protein [Empedobacter brevis]
MKKELKKAVFNWSGGKDSALALQKVLEGKEFEVIALLTTITAETNTSSIHGIPLELLKKQVESIGIPLYLVALTKDIKTYEDEMLKAVNHFKQLGVAHFIFGDIFLTDVKNYRESKLLPLGIEVVEPLWGKTSLEVMDEFLKSGIKSKIIVTQADKLDQSFIGRDLDRSVIDSFPMNVDVCGENGEYHTLSYAGDLFKTPFDFAILQTVLITHEFKLDTGEIKKCDYWQAKL